MIRKHRELGLLAIALAVATITLVLVLPVWSGGYSYTTHGPFGGVIQALTVAPDGRIFAGVYNGWLYTSTSDGASWTISKTGIANGARNIVDLDAGSNGVVYAASRGGGVFRTSNGGTSWTPVNTNLGNLNVLSILVDPTNPNDQYAGTSGSGVYKRTDPSSWQDMSVGCTTCIVQDLVMNSAGTLYLAAESDGTNYGVYTWTGTQWQAYRTGLPAATGVPTILPTAAGLWAGTAGGGVFYTTSGTWTARNNGLSGDALDVWELGSDGDGQIYAGTAAGLYKWNTSTSTWELRVGDLPGRGQLARAILSTGGNTLFIGTDGRGVFETTDGGATWVARNTGLTGYIIRAAGINPQYDWRVYAGTFRGGIFWSPNGGQSWEWRSEGLGDVEVESIAVTSPSGSPIYAGLNGQGVYRTDDLGALWVPKNNGLTGTALSVYALEFMPLVNSTVLYAGTENGLYKTDDSGELWFRSSTNLPYAVTALAIDRRPGQENLVYAGTRQNGVFKSIDAGANWSVIPGLSGDDAKILALTVDGNGILYSGSQGGMHEYSGGTWNETGPQVAIHALVTNPLSPTIIYAGSAEGVSPLGVIEKTIDLGWQPLTTGLGNWNVFALAIDDYVIQTLHAGTVGSSVWDYTFGGEPPPLAPEVGVDLDDGITIVQPGDMLTYTITYYNEGAVDATNVAITMTLPNYANYVSSDPPFTHLGGDLYGLIVDVIPANSVDHASFFVQLLDTGNPPASIYSVASIMDDGSSGADPYLFNNQEEDIDYFDFPPVFTVSKDAVPSPGTEVEPGDTIAYTIEYLNASQDEVVTNVILTDVIPANTTYVPGSIWPSSYGDDSNPAVLLWNIPSVAVQVSGTVGFQVTVNEPEPDSYAITNTAQAVTDQTPQVTSDPVVHTIAQPPILLVSKTAWPPPGTGVSPGIAITYTIAYTNAADASIDDVILVDLYDRTEDYVFQWADPAPTSGEDQWALGTLEPGEHGQVEIHVLLADPLPGNWIISNQAVLTDGQGNDYYSQVVTHTTVLPPDSPLTDLVVEDLHWDPPQPVAGEHGHFYATVRNEGNVDADGFFWVGLYIKPHPSTPPLDAGDLMRCYCLNQACTSPRQHYVAYVPGLAQGESTVVAFESIAQDYSADYPAPGTYDVYIQADLAFTGEGYHRYWGRYMELDEANNLMWRQLTIPVIDDGGVFLPLVYRGSRQ